MGKCECDLRTRLVGDGCRVCNPSLASEYADEAIEELRAVNADLLEALEGFVCYHSGHCCLDAQLNAIMDKARSAIASARG